MSITKYVVEKMVGLVVVVPDEVIKAQLTNSNAINTYCLNYANQHGKEADWVDVPLTPGTTHVGTWSVVPWTTFKAAELAYLQSIAGQ